MVILLIKITKYGNFSSLAPLAGEKCERQSRRVHACDARIVRALHASPTFDGSELVIWAMYSTLSVCALCMSVSKSACGSEVRSPV